MKRGAELLVLALLLTACATTAPAPQPSLAHDVDALLATAPFDKALWGVNVEEDDGTVLYARNAHNLMIPASNRKLFTAATVVNCIGADAQLVTSIYRDGEDLIIKGDGDPSLGSPRYERDAEFDRLATLLHDAGTTRVHDVIADVSLFSDRILVPGSWKVGNLPESYAAPADALAWHENAYGDHAIADPGLLTAFTLRDALLLHGIEVTGVPRVVTTPTEWKQQIASRRSPFIAQLLMTVLKNSHNLYAEMLLKRAGGGTYEEAFAREAKFAIEEAGVMPGEWRFVDGSGLSPDDLVTPAAIVKVLRWMNDPSRRGLWWTILAQPNNEGTLHHRVVTLENRMRGKTGTINGVNALSGIIAMPDGRYRYFSIVLNHHIGDGDEAVKVIDAVAERIAR
ncbi:MAG TPA: D-alanyl-D-alanine carboxypeptidase [Thermoanaerobaculia bacterium]|nr:D-alanyl-D-alanine carboxypeptidase [Thermoanaerobaculia bacterium]